MPCRSDYMEPTERERNAANKVVTGLNELADKLTHTNDVLREYLLGEASADRKVIYAFLNLSSAFNHELGRLRDKDKGVYGPARSNKTDGLFDHVVDLMATYEYLNELATRQRVMRPRDYEYIREQQNAHREADLSRLMKVFADRGDRERLKKVLDADATKPLEPQLGFDADDF